MSILVSVCSSGFVIQVFKYISCTGCLREVWNTRKIHVWKSICCKAKMTWRFDDLTAHFMLKNIFLKIMQAQCGKAGRAGEATDDNILQYVHIAWWMTKAANTHTECNTYCFSKAAVVTWMPLSVTFTRTWPILFFSYNSLPPLDLWCSE